ncbi:MAG: alpha/beta hydrolase [Proteobacteria bacterium]|nr:alpha/beta hydrolase [Pseudomonadota bacterium]
MTEPQDCAWGACKPYASPFRQRLEVNAPGLGRYVIDVSLPEGVDPGERMPVIVLLDGNLLFELGRAVLHNRIGSLGSRMPPSVIVGVGYPEDEGLSGFYARRNHDFHEAWDMNDPMGRRLREIFEALQAAEGKAGLKITAGGYGDFLRFLGEALLPGLAERFPVDLSARHTLVGDSSGGHFVLRALFDAASPFSRYVAISPSLGAAEGSIQKAEAAYAAAHGDLEADVFVCAGVVETGENRDNALAGFGSAVTWAAERFALRQWPSARLAWELMNQEDHASIAPRAIAAGLRSVHGLRPGAFSATPDPWRDLTNAGSGRPS